MNRFDLKVSRYLLGILLALVSLSFFGCSDNNNSGGDVVAYDPSKAVSISDFIPKDGGVGQRLVVLGDNFGNDTSKVKVFVGGKRAVLINVKGNALYCYVPSQAYTGEVQVTVGDSLVGTQTAIADSIFHYQRKMVVGTLVGYRNERDDQGWKDGPFETASGFRNDGCLKFDPTDHDKLYVVFDGADIQLIDLKSRFVKTIISKSSFDDKRLRSLDFTPDGKYMIVATDRDDRQNQSPSVWIVTRNEDGTFSNGSSRQILAAYKQCNGASLHPNGELYFNSYENGQVFRMDMQNYFNTVNNGGTWKPNFVDGNFKMLFTIQDTGWEFQIDIHPSGKYAYIVVLNQHYILRTDYNDATHEFAPPYIVAGQMKTAGWVDGVGTSAQLNRPYQGTFVKNPEYVKEGREDVYDFYFCDNQNHCVRYLTPDGIVRTYAGRGSSTAAADNNVWGTDDGDLRKVARFRDPTGIAYDERTNTFYILDTVGRKIRTISMEKEQQ